MPAVQMTAPPTVPKPPDMHRGQQQQSETLSDMQMKQYRDRQQQEKERQQRLRDANWVNVAPAKEKAATKK